MLFLSLILSKFKLILLLFELIFVQTAAGTQEFCFHTHWPFQALVYIINQYSGFGLILQPCRETGGTICDADMRPLYICSTNTAKSLSPQIWCTKGCGCQADVNQTETQITYSFLVKKRPTNIFQKLWAEDAVCSVGECLIRVNWTFFLL